MKCRIGLPIVLTLMCCTFLSADFNSGWVHYLGDPQRTAYTSEKGPDTPEVLWKVKISCYDKAPFTGERIVISGDFDTSPFIMEGKVMTLWKNDMDHTTRTTVLFTDLLTGETDPEPSTVCAPRGYFFFRVFPLNDCIVGISFKDIDEFDPTSIRTIFLAEIPEKFFGGSNAYPILLKNKIIIPTTPSICLSTPDFSVLWSLGDITSQPDWVSIYVVGDEDLGVFIMEKDSYSRFSTQRLLAVDPSTGALRWKSDPLEGASWLTLGRDILYCGGKELWAFNRDGSKQWEFKPESSVCSNFVLGPDALYFADGTNNLYKVDLNGNLVWKTDYEGSSFFQTHLIGADDILYCIGSFPDEKIDYDQSQITAYSMVDGSRIWEIERGTLGGVNGPPAVANGILVVGTMDGEIVAFASDPELFVRQGEAFISAGLKEKAGDSYRKAVNLYEKKGNIEKAEEIKKRIIELGLPLETQSPSPLASPPSSMSPSPEPSLLTKKSTIFVASFATITALIIAMTYYLIKRKS